MKHEDKIELLTAQKAAEYLSTEGSTLSPRTLANWRSQSKGPKPTKIGSNVYYTYESLNAYIRRRTGFDTTDAA